MIAHTPDDATTWRDLADQLTTWQVAAIERLEAKMAAAGTPDAREALLEVARDEAAHNLVIAWFADVPVPAGAETDGIWSSDESGEQSRAVVWREFPSVGGVGLAVDGRQTSTGEVTPPKITVFADIGAQLTGAQARELAAQLLEAADKLDELNGAPRAEGAGG